MERMDALLQALLRKHDPDGMQQCLRRLWRHWPDIVDEHIAEMAKPIGHRKRTLLIGVEDSMIMQELTFYSPRILQQVNDFLGTPLFDRVMPELIRDRMSLDAIRRELAPLPRPQAIRPATLGTKAGTFAPDSAVGRCYEAYVRLFGDRNRPDSDGSRSLHAHIPKEDIRR
ncbi:hypothetical protein GGQ74_001800 [Desulfobaculum xiamenense]|uniref:DUF721 domain-containing protein n=1 Tax=Desulfobaculum xiamenense TaxID=995050 RepID=A0A846QLR0_9BACT|nr:DUF721 domain-containing protein [Desulfobaculum xiamenense]NJB68127.1 hypothetical protein [Desulfobaculum xiamenense]